MILYVYEIVCFCCKNFFFLLSFREFCDLVIREINDDKVFDEIESDFDVSM